MFYDFWDRCNNKIDLWECEYVDIFNRYSEPYRHYHTMNHIWHCLNELSEVMYDLYCPVAVEAAIYFHDIIYNTHANDNESKSALYAIDTLARWGADFKRQRRSTLAYCLYAVS